MRKLLLASVAILSLGAAAPAIAQSSMQSQQNAGAVVGGSAGAATGATAGFFVGGPVGAVVGGFAGALLGGEAGVSAATVNYVETHPVRPVYLSGPISIGTRLNKTVNIYAIKGDPAHGYIYANGRAYVVDLHNRKVLMSPGYTIPKGAVSYASKHRGHTVTIKGDVAPGYRFKRPMKYGQIPNDSAYAYVYVNGHPALVDTQTNTIVWVGN